MPYYRTASTVRRAVDAVLAQTYDDLLLYVVNDGDRETPPWPELADITDPRLIRVDLPDNRGRYFADAVVLAACGTPWFAVHDADDVADPAWLAELHAACVARGWAAAFCPQRVTSARRSYIEPVADPLQAVPGPVRHLAHHAGVYNVDALRAVGGPSPSYRIGYDTALVNLLSLHAPIGAVDRPLYTRHIRAGSLTTAPATRKSSPARQRVRQRITTLMARAFVDGPAMAAGTDTDPADAAAVSITAAKLSSGDLTPGLAQPPVGAPAGVLTEPVWGGWALDAHTAHELATYLHRVQPRTVAEFGSGMSTVLLAEYADRTGATVLSYEHNPRYHRTTATALGMRGLGKRVDLRLADIADRDTPAGPMPWYDAPIPDGVDFALVDGPPGSIGRGAAMFALWPHLSTDRPWQVWLDDATLSLPGREREADALDRWVDHLPVRYDIVPTPKGLARIVADGAPFPSPIDAGDIGVTIVTSARADLLAATLGSLHWLAPGFLESAHVAVLHHGADGDHDTAEVLGMWANVIDHVAVVGDRLPLGAAVSAMHAVPVPRPYVLHLEDDWQLATTWTGWLDQARAVLREDPDVAQVRLRHRGDTVRREHMITRKPLWWRPGWYGTTVCAAHYTLNPSLMRAEDIGRLWPADGELAAARTFYALGWQVAQSTPGAFRHIGDGASLRLGQRGRRP